MAGSSTTPGSTGGSPLAFQVHSTPLTVNGESPSLLSFNIEVLRDYIRQHNNRLRRGLSLCPRFAIWFVDVSASIGPQMFEKVVVEVLRKSVNQFLGPKCQNGIGYIITIGERPHTIKITPENFESVIDDFYRRYRGLEGGTNLTDAILEAKRLLNTYSLGPSKISSNTECKFDIITDGNPE